ncbi:hypothetical protein JYT96_02510 [Gammaproteobacteria bacterium AH-315-C21]|nr:hypothetical protein [Gammaproteobacteria bacterium AH-315-C21]
MINNVIAILLAGSKGSRLLPLINQRGQPTIPFGEKYRIIDFTLAIRVNT